VTVKRTKKFVKGKSMIKKRTLQLSAVAAVSFILSSATPASAELWKCVPKAGGSEYFTETPSFGDDVQCDEVQSSRYSKPGSGGSADPKEKAKKGKSAGKLTKEERAKIKAKGNKEKKKPKPSKKKPT